MTKKIDEDSDFVFNSIEIDLDKNIYKIDGKPINKCDEIRICIKYGEVATRLIRHEFGHGERKQNC